MRGAIRSDAAAIAALDMELFPDNCFNEHTIIREISAGSGLVIYDGDTLAAYTLVRWDWDVVDIIRIGVRPSYQARGFGTKMLMTTLNATRLDVMLCVDKLNQRALTLYLSHGFKIIGQLAKSWVMLRST
jgi:ribosomal protein S18 acetylase RimI-like enzyme